MNTASAERISLRSPAALCCAVPHLLGFHPRSSAVLVWMAAGRLILTQRLDLPVAGVSVDEWVAALWSHHGAELADEVIVVLVVDGTHVGPPHGELQSVSNAMCRQAQARSISVRDVIVHAEDRWWSMLCSDLTCCPQEGQLISPELCSTVKAHFASDGLPPLRSRSDVVAALNRDEHAAAAVLATGVLQKRRLMTTAARERWRDSALVNLLAWTSSNRSAVSPHRLAHLLMGLRDVRVRDTLLWHLSRAEVHELRTAQGQLCHLLRQAPPGETAPIATVAAGVLWLLGDGVRAVAACDRALGDDCHYSLGRLIAASISAGLPPAEWRVAMGSLTWATCRHGEDLQPQVETL
jgi:hypothetical protein